MYVPSPMHLAMDCGLTEKIFVLLQMQLGQTYIELSYCIKVVSAFCLKNDTYQIKRDFCNSSPTLTLTFFLFHQPLVRNILEQCPAITLPFWLRLSTLKKWHLVNKSRTCLISPLSTSWIWFYIISPWYFAV